VKETEQGGSQASEGGCLREPEGLEDVLGDDGVVDAGDFSSWSGSSCRWSTPATSPPGPATSPPGPAPSRARRGAAGSRAWRGAAGSTAWRGAAGSRASDGEDCGSEQGLARVRRGPGK
jgi:hypothetical protein